MFAPQYADYKRETYRTAGPTSAAPPPSSRRSVCPEGDLLAFYAEELAALKNGTFTDWQDLISRQGSQVSHQLAVTGGNDRNQFAVSGNLLKQIGVTMGQDYDRKQMRVNYEGQATSRFRVGGSALVVRSLQRLGRSDGLYGEALADTPLSVPYDSAGNIIFKPTPDAQRDNPLSDINNWKNDSLRTRLFGTLFASSTSCPGLDYRVNFGPDTDVLAQRRSSSARRRRASRARARRVDPRPQDVRLHARQPADLQEAARQRAQGRRHAPLLDREADVRGDFGALAEPPVRVGAVLQPGRRCRRLRHQQPDPPVGAPVVHGPPELHPARQVPAHPHEPYRRLVAPRRGEQVRHLPVGGPRLPRHRRDANQKLGPLNSLKLRGSFGTTGNTSVDPYQTQGSLNRTIYALSNAGAFGFSRALSRTRTSVGAHGDVGWRCRLRLHRRASDRYGRLLPRQHERPADGSPAAAVHRLLGDHAERRRDRATPVSRLALTAITLDGWHGMHWTNDITFAAQQ